MTVRASFIPVLLVALVFVGLHWIFADWAASIGQRVWVYEQLQRWGGGVGE